MPSVAFGIPDDPNIIASGVVLKLLILLLLSFAAAVFPGPLYATEDRKKASYMDRTGKKGDTMRSEAEKEKTPPDGAQRSWNTRTEKESEQKKTSEGATVPPISLYSPGSPGGEDAEADYAVARGTGK
ncbi:hypothetical protein NDU88_005457 [Pleurodeles waltl]|uniref:Uncharacterized protein n=1 Tax=Pleurodeles waltl TaxID=8319 RepID=A0AAV7TAQ2_PLEWA|nr:hypothetical protein NDU88_005457 [Pleurodeles waltl]